METTTNKLGITKGMWRTFKVRDRFYIDSLRTIPNSLLAEVYAPEDAPDGEMEANAQLIADAGTTASITGKLPSQLAEENKMLLEALDKCCNALANVWSVAPDSWKDALSKTRQLGRDAIAKAEGRSE